ncbi:hypothetical protein MF406_14110 [Georgenia sp. TF02-10]|uniref:hypothetical protein n=1 Tax=Georgenia sp. TF02-10 TaxID=2917725 RepID=UPI001FA6D1CB|nr:hypothetical protein [Georgenia sp. TF02-10]UNX54067.1 hypothetical protein MF406_14110 [Georgenia sp. TF02-10]
MAADRVEVWRAADGWRWRYREGRSGLTLADSGQGYSRRVDCLAAARRVVGRRPRRLRVVLADA